LRARLTLRSGDARDSLRTGETDGSDRPHGALGTRRALWTDRTDRAGRAVSALRGYQLPRCAGWFVADARDGRDVRGSVEGHTVGDRVARGVVPRPAPREPDDPLRSALALWSRCTGWADHTLRARLTLRSGDARDSLRTGETDGSDRPHGALGTRRALWTDRTDRAGRAVSALRGYQLPRCAGWFVADARDGRDVRGSVERHAVGDRVARGVVPRPAPREADDPLRSALALWSRCTGCADHTLRAGLTLRSGYARDSLRTGETDGSDRTHGALGTRRALWTDRTDRAGRAVSALRGDQLPRCAGWFVADARDGRDVRGSVEGHAVGDRVAGGVVPRPAPREADDSLRSALALWSRGTGWADHTLRAGLTLRSRDARDSLRTGEADGSGRPHGALGTGRAL